MRQLFVASKVLSVIFAIIWMAGCGNIGTTDTGAAADDAASRAAEQAAAQEQAAADDAKRAAQGALEDAVANAGNLVWFDFDKSILKPKARKVLDAHIALLKTNRDSIRLEGHTDERGTREYNMALGERRAMAAADYMSVNGISSYRIESVSYGEERPVARGTGESNWSQNRRVEIK